MRPFAVSCTVAMCMLLCTSVASTRPHDRQQSQPTRRLQSSSQPHFPWAASEMLSPFSRSSMAALASKLPSLPTLSLPGLTRPKPEQVRFITLDRPNLDIIATSASINGIGSMSTHNAVGGSSSSTGSRSASPMFGEHPVTMTQMHGGVPHSRRLRATAAADAATGGPMAKLTALLDKVQAGLPKLEDLANVPSLPKPNHIEKSIKVGDKQLKVVLGPPAAQTSPAAAYQGPAQAVPAPTTLGSVAEATGFAFNGGKAAAKAEANAQHSSAAMADAVAIADRTSVSLARAGADADNPGRTGLSMATSMATAVGDKSSLSISESGSRSVGLGGTVTHSDMTANGAAAGNSVSYVGGTAVSAAVGLDGSSKTTSVAKGAAEDHSRSATRADAISIGAFNSDAQGSATSSAQAAKGATATSQSLMESFAIKQGNTNASSTADATAAGLGASIVRDKAAAIGVLGAKADANTASNGAAGVLGLSVVDSVARAITADNQKVCADAVTKTYSDLATGPQMDLSTFILTLQQRAGQQCVTSFKDQAAKAAATGAAMQQLQQQQQRSLPTFESLSKALSDRTKGLMMAAHNAVSNINNFIKASPDDVPQMVQDATWGAAAAAAPTYHAGG